MKLLVLGAGGHAKVVIDAARAAGLDIAAVVGMPGDAPSVLGIQVGHDADSVEADGFIVAVGDNATRKRMFDQQLSRGRVPVSVLHPTAVVSPSAEIGAGSFLAAGTVVNPQARVGRNVILNTGCTVDHDCVIGDHAHVGPGVSLCGAVALGEGVLLGVGSCAISGTTIGEWSIVGAGAAVAEDLDGGMVYVGVPAKPIREAGS